MKNRKIKFAVIVAGLSITALLTACGSKEKASEGEKVITVGETEDEVTDEEGFVEGSLDDDSSDTGYEIKRTEADELVSEKLEGTLATASYSERVDLDDGGYYIYSVSDSEDSDKKDVMLAVDAKSGEVYAYKNGKVLPYSESEYYNPELDSSVEWTGTYKNSSYVLDIVENEPGGFDFSIKEDGKDDKLVQGYAVSETFTKASSVIDGETFTLTLDGDKVILESDKSGAAYAGTYEIK